MDSIPCSQFSTWVLLCWVLPLWSYTSCHGAMPLFALVCPTLEIKYEVKTHVLHCSFVQFHSKCNPCMVVPTLLKHFSQNCNIFSTTEKEINNSSSTLCDELRLEKQIRRHQETSLWNQYFNSINGYSLPRPCV